MPMPLYLAWERHLKRHPPDGQERVLSKIVQMLQSALGGRNDVLDCDVRPWNYTDKEKQEARQQAREAELERRRRHIEEQIQRGYSGVLPGDD